MRRALALDAISANLAGLALTERYSRSLPHVSAHFSPAFSSSFRPIVRVSRPGMQSRSAGAAAGRRNAATPGDGRDVEGGDGEPDAGTARPNQSLLDRGGPASGER